MRSAGAGVGAAAGLGLWGTWGGPAWLGGPRAVASLAPPDRVLEEVESPFNHIVVARNGDGEGDYARLSQLLDETPPVYLRDLLRLKRSQAPLPLEQVARRALARDPGVRPATLAPCSGRAGRVFAFEPAGVEV